MQGGALDAIAVRSAEDHGSARRPALDLPRQRQGRNILQKCRGEAEGVVTVPKEFVSALFNKIARRSIEITGIRQISSLFGGQAVERGALRLLAPVERPGKHPFARRDEVPVGNAVVLGNSGLRPVAIGNALAHRRFPYQISAAPTVGSPATHGPKVLRANDGESNAPQGIVINATFIAAPGRRR